MAFTNTAQGVAEAKPLAKVSVKVGADENEPEPLVMVNTQLLPELVEAETLAEVPQPVPKEILAAAQAVERLDWKF